MEMKKVFALIGLAVAFSFGGGEHGFVKMETAHIKELGIKLYEVKKRPAGKVVRIPAEVHENPTLTYRVYSPVVGIVKELYVKEGDRVRKGDALARIYSPSIADLVGRLRMAEVRLRSAEKVFERDRELYSEGVIQYTRFFNSMVSYERARGEYEAIRDRLRSFGDVEGWDLILRSPGEGYVIKQNVVLGDSVGPDTLLFSIHSHDVLWVYGWAEESVLGDLKAGSKARVITSGGDIPCSMDYVSHEMDRKTRRVKVRCVAKNREHLLRPGMFVDMEVFSGGKERIVVPKAAVQEIEGEKVVFVKVKGGFEVREVSVVEELDGYYVIGKGLGEGETIAVEGTLFLKTKLVGIEEGGHTH